MDPFRRRIDDICTVASKFVSIIVCRVKGGASPILPVIVEKYQSVVFPDPVIRSLKVHALLVHLDNRRVHVALLDSGSTLFRYFEPDIPSRIPVSRESRLS